MRGGWKCTSPLTTVTGMSKCSFNASGMSILSCTSSIVPRTSRSRGYWPGDSRAIGIHPADAVSRHMMAVTRSTWMSLGGLNALMSPVADDVELCARALLANLTVVVVGGARGVSTGPLLLADERESSYTAEVFNPRSMAAPHLHAIKAFTDAWKDFFRARRVAGYLTDAKFTWVIHCGGSQGLEATTIMQTLYKYE